MKRTRMKAWKWCEKASAAGLVTETVPVNNGTEEVVSNSYFVCIELYTKCDSVSEFRLTTLTLMPSSALPV